jgi:hypothetical protein
MAQIQDRRGFLVQSSALILASCGLSSGCSRDPVNDHFEGGTFPPAREWPEIPNRPDTRPFPAIKSFDRLSHYSARELVELAIGGRLTDLWLADIHVAVANETMDVCFDEKMSVQAVDALKHKIDSLAKVISGEIDYQTRIQGGEIPLRQKVEIINAVFYGLSYGRFSVADLKCEDGRNKREHTNPLFDEVWMRRRGICEDLVSAYMCVVDRLNQAGHALPLSAATVPGHIFIRADDHHGPFFIELLKEGQIYELVDVLRDFKIKGRPHLIPGPLTSVACAISNAGWTYHVKSGKDWGTIVDPAKARAWLELLELSITCAPDDTFYRVKLADQLIVHGHHLSDPTLETRLKKLVGSIESEYPQSREPDILLARFYASEIGGKRIERSLELIERALQKPEPISGDQRSVLFFVEISSSSIKRFRQTLE